MLYQIPLVRLKTFITKNGMPLFVLDVLSRTSEISYNINSM